jgi:hypothetical protein
MAALLIPLDNLFAALSLFAPAWVQSLVFVGMTVSVAVGVEQRARLAGNAPAAPSPIVASGVAPVVEVIAPVPASVAQAELQAELRAVLADVQDDADRLNVQMELAIPPGLVLRSAPGALQPVLRGLLRNAVEHTPNGRVFIGAMRADACVRLIVIDDGKTGARPIAAELRKPLARLLAGAGAGLVVDHRPGDGTTLVLSLPEAG